MVLISIFLLSDRLLGVNGIKSVRSMQKAISDAVWHEDKMIDKHQAMVCNIMCMGSNLEL